MEPELFAAQVADAFAHLYDLVYLRSHPLTELVTPAPDLPHKKKAWLLHDVLLGVIEELDPGFHAPADGREKRRYRLLSMRYSEGIASKGVADTLAISLRHYYREHDTAIEAVAAILWERYGRNYRAPRASTSAGSTPSDPLSPLHTGATESQPRPPESLFSSAFPAAEESPNRQALLRAEAAHFQGSGQEMRLGEVLPGVIALAEEMARAKGLRLTLDPPSSQAALTTDMALLPEMALPMDGTMVRQILLGLLSYLGEQFVEGEIVVRVRSEDQEQVVEIVGVGQKSASTTLHEREEQLATLYELAGLQSAQLRPLSEEHTEGATDSATDSVTEGFTLHLPRLPRRTVLLVDDNSDILELYQRYLQQREYRAISVQSGGEALRLASQLQPQAIVLDLMLPEQDGWEILQRLTNHPATHAIPVVICSILRARQLALALGAAAFLEKPVDETTLLGVLDTLIA